jgi:hypothetical protein
VTRELQHGLVWYNCRLTKPPSRDTIDRFLTDLEHVIDDLFAQLVEQAAARGLLYSMYSIDSTHVEAIQYNDAASWTYDPTAEVLLRVRLYDRLNRRKVSDRGGVHTSQATDQEMAMRVTGDALAVETPSWMLGDSVYDILDWHDHLLAAGVVPVVPYNSQNPADPKEIEYRVEARI